ncbi:calpain [Acrasis kona]|uniref:Calpain n=1 Tax=Acrasis kona TaxID=1008807 RepID=A0AAW2Z2F8_9EUKA
MSVFCDDVFPPDITSLCFEPLFKKPDFVKAITQWRRPRQWCSTARLFDTVGYLPGDVEQGQIGDCWLLSAFSLVGIFPDVLKRLFVYSNEKEGKYTVRLYHNGKWNEVTVDDRIPCGSDGLPAYGHNINKKEIWVVILEKAVAKLFGSYEGIDGGYLEEGVAMLTGGRPERVYVNSIGDQAHKKAPTLDQLWNKMVLYNSENTLMGAAISNSSEQQDKISGLVAGHAYGILDVRQTADRKHRLVKLRNPWGQFEWKGAWCDTSKLWTTVYKKELDAVVSDDGVFWMSFNDFASNFDKITCCRVFNNSLLTMKVDPLIKQEIKHVVFPNAQWKTRKVEGGWTDENSGGMSNDTSYQKNPRVKLTCRGNGRYFIIISRPNLPMDADAQYYRSAIGFSIHRGDGSGNMLRNVPRDDTPNALMQHPVYGRYNSCELELTSGDYVITPLTQYANRRGTYVLEVYGEKDFDLKPLEGNQYSADIREGMVSARGNRPDDIAIPTVTQALNNMTMSRTQSKFKSTFDHNRTTVDSSLNKYNTFNSMRPNTVYAKSRTDASKLNKSVDRTRNTFFVTTYQDHFNPEQRWG